MGIDPFEDMQQFLQGKVAPLVIDVGANIGQSATKFKKIFPTSIIHSFEPSPSTFQKLNENCASLDGVTTWNFGIGSTNSTIPFLENEFSDMSSFLAPSEFSWGKVVKTTDVKVITLDDFSQDQSIDYVHVLKSDTQGFDFEVFKGASRLMDRNKIALIYFEIIFSDMYKNLPLFYEIFRYLSERNFSLVSFYDQHYQKDLVSWTDALFVNREFNCKRSMKPSADIK